MDLPEAFVRNLPEPGLKLDMSLQQNEMFILGMGEDEYNDAMVAKDYKTLCKYLYRVQKIAGQFFMRFNTDTTKLETPEAQKIGHFIRISSVQGWNGLSPHKVCVTVLGEIVPLDD